MSESGRRVHGWVDGWVGRWERGSVGAWVDGWVDGCVGGWMSGWGRSGGVSMSGGFYPAPFSIPARPLSPLFRRCLHVPALELWRRIPQSSGGEKQSCLLRLSRGILPSGVTRHRLLRRRSPATPPPPSLSPIGCDSGSACLSCSLHLDVHVVRLVEVAPPLSPPPPPQAARRVVSLRELSGPVSRFFD